MVFLYTIEIEKTNWKRIPIMSDRHLCIMKHKHISNSQYYGIKAIKTWKEFLFTVSRLHLKTINGVPLIELESLGRNYPYKMQ